MKTYLLDDEQVRRYIVDFLSRLTSARRMPDLWCPITESGRNLAAFMAKCAAEKFPRLLSQVQLLRMDLDAPDQKIHFSEDPAALIPGKAVLLLDGAVHSGHTMAVCSDEILKHRPAEVASYALVIKRSSKFIPTNWGIMTDDTDRAYFLLDPLPNNRLSVGAGSSLPVQIRRLDPSSLVCHRFRRVWSQSTGSPGEIVCSRWRRATTRSARMCWSVSARSLASSPSTGSAEKAWASTKLLSTDPTRIRATGAFCCASPTRSHGIRIVASFS